MAKKKPVERKAHRPAGTTTGIPAVQSLPPAVDAEYKVGPGRPPLEYRWKPGQSGNPAGPSRPRTNLYFHLCKYIGMTNRRLKEIGNRKDLTQAQRIALTLVAQLRAGVPRRNVIRVLEQLIDREEGKPPISIRIAPDDRALTPRECEEIRREMAALEGARPESEEDEP